MFTFVLFCDLSRCLRYLEYGLCRSATAATVPSCLTFTTHLPHACTRACITLHALRAAFLPTLPAFYPVSLPYTLLLPCPTCPIMPALPLSVLML